MKQPSLGERVGGSQNLPLPIMGPRLTPICRCQAVLGARKTPEAAQGWPWMGVPGASAGPEDGIQLLAICSF